MSGGVLHVAGPDVADGYRPVAVGTERWWRWLDTASATTFRVQDADPPYTARRETRGPTGYWYGYRRDGGRLRKAYLGLGTDLSAERLQEAAELLAGPAAEPRFVGRGEALVELRRLLRRARMVTLVGPGGVGKSRLAAALAEQVSARFPDGVHVVRLASPGDAGLLTATVALALGLPDQPGAALAAAIGHRRMLIVLDDCQDVAEPVAALVAALLAGCRGVGLLATSRVPLPVGGTTWPVSPLSVPAPSANAAAVLGSEAGRLFRLRARRVRPTFAVTEENAATVARLCRRLDGMPLAVELVAGRASALPVGALGDRLDEMLDTRTAEHTGRGSIGDVVAWSHTQLTEPERCVFARLSVFASAWDVGGAEAVCGADPGVLDTLTRLVELSLVQVVADGRFRMLGLVRRVAAELLDRRAEHDAVHDRHAAHLLARAERADAMGYDRDSERHRRELAGHPEDLRAALEHFLRRGDVPAARRMGTALAQFWSSTGAIPEGRARMAELLALPGDPPARLLLGAGLLAALDGDYPAARRLLDDGVAGARRDADRVAEANGLHLVGLLAWWRRDYVGAAAAAAAGERIARAAGCPGLVGLNLWIRAQVASAAGDGNAAWRLAEMALERCAAADHALGVALSLNVMGQVLLDRGEVDTARELLERALLECRTSSWPAAELATLVTLAVAALHGAAPHGAALDEAHRRAHQALALAREQLGPSRLCQPLEVVALLAAARHEWPRCLRLAAAAGRLRETHNVHAAPAERRRLAAATDRARRVLGPVAAAAEAAGRAASIDAVLADAATPIPTPTPAVGASDGRPLPTLTPRQGEVARLVAAGLSNRATATRLRIAEATVERHLVNAFRELGIGSRTQLAAWVARHDR
ncbi:MAG: ATP-binding protein [Pseudonocardia sp.]